MRIGTLPATQPWERVIEKITNGLDAGVVAEATLDAAHVAFRNVGKDAGFRESVILLTQVAVASGKPDAAAQLAKLGIQIQDVTSLAEVAVSVSSELERRVESRRQRSDFGELSQNALASALVGHLRNELTSLFQPSKQDVLMAFKELSKPAVFGAVARDFCANLTDKTLGYFLSKTLGTQIGEGQRFATTNQVTQFERAMRLHCHEASAIMEKFASDWLSKRRWVEKGDISRDSAERFGWFGMQKMRAELNERAKQK